MRINALILAAGLSSRLSEFKPLVKINGKTLIETVVELMFACGIDNIVLVLGYRGKEIEESLHSCSHFDKIIFIYNENYAVSDMLESIKTGLRVMPECDAFFLALSDMPAIKPETLLSLKNALTGNIKVVFPTLLARRKHPVLISYDCCSDILLYSAEGGLRGIWGKYEGYIYDLALEDPGCDIDIDTQYDFEACKNYMRGK